MVDAREPVNRGHTESSLQAVGISPSGMGCARDSGEGMHDMMDQLVSGSGHAAVWSSTGSGQRCWEQSGRCGLHWGCSSGRVVVGRHVLSPREARVDRKCRSGTGRERVVVEEITVAAFVDTPITARRTKSTLWLVPVCPGRQTHPRTRLTTCRLSWFRLESILPGPRP